MLTIPLEGLPERAGTSLGVSPWVRVDQQRIDIFSEATEDRQWIHVDPVRAASGPLGGTIGHGYLSLSLVSRFILDVLQVQGALAVVNYGLDRVRFPSPVGVGSLLRGDVQLLEVKEVPGGFQTVSRVMVEIQGNDKPACVADVLTRFLR